ncbi:MAG: PBSX family phage terminase large subunit [Clostridia bacterium]|nr:PBSX family phage terminase large subunit [Clostridia bacterium]
MNDENLVPFTSKQSREEAVKNGAKGGKKSGEVRRKKRDMKSCMEMLLKLPPCTRKDYNNLAAAGVNLDNITDDELNNLLVVNAALLNRAKNGDVNAIKELRNIIRDDDYLKHKIKYENQKLKIEKQKTEKPVVPEKEYNGIPANLIAPSFSSLLFDIQEHEHSEYVLPGGRGSTKSSFISLNVIDLIMRNDNLHACVMRQVGDTMRITVYQQVLWAISALGLDDEFYCTVSPLEITRIKTGQKIYFRGADDPRKIKSIKVPFGYIGIVWFEELDQFSGEEAIRSFEQSIIRGGDIAYKFKSFNPPKSTQNWANKYLKVPRDDRLVTESTYLTVPKKWLGKQFLDDAEFLKETNPTAYENEYLGVVNGTGGNVFDNVNIREITDEEIKTFDRIYCGIDWGWYPDPFAFTKMTYIASQHKLIIFDEYRCNKQSNEQTANVLKARGVTANDLIICDSAEMKSIGDYRAFGLLARPAEKGPGSVDYSMKWLQSLKSIEIDNRRCPETAKEFLDYEYERDKEGNVISGYPDKDNHSIDSVRYACQRIYRNRGQ